MREYVSSSFSRKPRGLNELSRWKASEFKQFCLYLGLVALKNVLPTDMYNHFICLHVCMTIYSSESLCSKYCDFSDKLARVFVRNFGIIYGTEFISYNVHSFSHIGFDAKRFQSVENVSCFPFESALKNSKS